MLGDKRGLSLGGVDTTILHHYFYILIYCYLLIFIILGYNTYVIYLFCMFDDYGRTNHRSPESAGKSIIKTPYLRSSFYEDNHRQVPIIPDDGGSQKGGPRWCPWGPHHLKARMAPRRASRWCRGPGPPGLASFCVLLPPITLR